MDNKEIINAQRTIAYINTFGLPLSISEECWCDNIFDLLGEECLDSPGQTGYCTPVADPAPWYDPAIPESADFLGFLPISFEGTDSTFTRTSTPTINGGSVLGRLIPQERVLTWTGLLIARTCCAADYGLRWLTAELSNAGGCEGCNTADLDILWCCPATTGEVAVACGVNAPDLGALACSSGPACTGIYPIAAIPQEDAFRMLKRTGLIDGPSITLKREIGCGSDCGSGCLYEVEFSIVAGNPYLHKEPIDVCMGLKFTCSDECVEYVTDCPDEECPEPVDCTVDDRCEPAAIPVIPGFQDPCACDPLDPSDTIYCSISNDTFGFPFEGVPVITIFSGDKPLRNVKIKIFENPAELPCDQLDNCAQCSDILVRYIPPSSTLTIDGTLKQVNIQCPGHNVPEPAENLLGSPFNWPVLKCTNYCISLVADCFEDDPNDPLHSTQGIAPNHFVNIQVVPRTM